jgi:PAS domain S-box-containing protein
METDLPRSASPEQSIADASERYRALLASSPDGVWLLDRHGRIDEANEAMARMLDRDAAELRHDTSSASPAAPRKLVAHTTAQLRSTWRRHAMSSQRRHSSTCGGD